MEVACSRCWLKPICSCIVVLISAQHPIVYWSGSETLAMASVGMTSSEAAVLTAWGKTGSWWGLQALCTHTYQADLGGAARCSGHWQFRLPDFWSCSEESLTTQLCRHSLIYIQCIDLPWLIMVQEEVLRVLLHITGRRKSAYSFVSNISKQRENQSFTYDSWLWNRHPCVCIMTSHIAYIFY